jgi:hypothetical protein
MPIQSKYQSPFAAGTYPKELENLFQPVDESLLARRKYAQLSLRIRRKLSTSKSGDVDRFIPRYHLYNESAGVLMVDHKKPFKVRFNMQATIIHQ